MSRFELRLSRRWLPLLLALLIGLALAVAAGCGGGRLCRTSTTGAGRTSARGGAAPTGASRGASACTR